MELTVDMNVEIDREVCIGAGLCVLQAPAVFDQDEEDGRVVLRRHPTDDDEPRARDAVLLCPSGALRSTAE